MGALSHFCASLAAVLLLCSAEVARGGGEPTVRETIFNAQVVDIKWLGSDTKIMLLLTQDAQIHRSTDGGRVWSSITTQIGGPSFQVLSMVVSPADRKVVAVIGRHLEHYISEDAGATWREVKLPAGRTRMFWFHDSRPHWALFSSWTHGCRWVRSETMPGEAEDGGQCNHALYVTKDLGKTFTQISSHVLQFDWGDAPHEDRIYFTHFKDKSKPQPRFDHWMADVEFAFTDDGGKQITEVIDGGNKFVISHGYILVATVEDKKLGLMVSKDAGSNFEKVVMPRHLKESSYIVLDTSEDAVVLHVNHGHGMGHIYVSDQTGVHYTLSLANNVRGSSDCAFDRVMNLRGIYLANIRDPSPNDFALPNPSSGDDKPTPKSSDEESDGESALGGLSTRTQGDRTARSLEDSDAPSFRMRLDAESAGDAHLGGLSTLSQADRTARSSRNSEARRLRRRPDFSPRRLEESTTKKIRTVMSFDRGGAWTYLRPPAKDSLGDPIVCPPDSCWLHMHDITEFDKFAPFYSYTNAVGIIMGSGNVGPYLTHDPATTNTYVSRDGGLTWAEASKGLFIYEFGNHGGLLMMADWAQETRQALYSINQGYSWRSTKFAELPMNVSNILTEINAMSTNFVIFGTRGTKGVLYHVDLDTLGLPVCKGLFKVDLAASDYETWTPSDGKSAERCLLGRQSLYTRRKQLAGCMNNKAMEWPVQKKNCSCSKEDFECEAGFTRAVEHMSCQPEHQTDFYEDEEGNPGVCKDKDYYDIDMYRKVSGDTCTGGWRPEKFRLPCKVLQAEALATLARKSGGGKSSWISWPLLVKGVVAFLVLIVLCCLWRSKTVRVCVLSTKIKLSGQRDYSRSVADPPSAVDYQAPHVPTNLGASNKDAEMNAVI